jgi:hypothetical protein
VPRLLGVYSRLQTSRSGIDHTSGAAGKEGMDYYETYDIDNQVGRDQAHGTFIAPSSGIHGWFWENKTGKEVTLKLMSAGLDFRKSQRQGNRGENDGPGCPARPSEDSRRPAALGFASRGAALERSVCGA